MTQEFIPYEQALELKELGFKYGCQRFYNKNKKLKWSFANGLGQEYFNQSDAVAAPLYQQAFRWFEYKGYRNYVASNQFGGKVNYWFAITPPEELTYSDTKGRTTKEEAELACLKKLIEITKNK